MCGTTMIDPTASPSPGATDSEASSSCCGPTPWMDIALGELGVRETPGLNTANPRVMEYHQSSGFTWGTDDSTATNAWCASFVSWCLIQAGYTKANNGFRADSYSRTVPNVDGNGWPNGKVIPIPVYGATARKRRRGGGHVGFVAGYKPGNKDAFGILGGNQRDEVNVTEFPVNTGGSATFIYMVPSDYRWECCELQDYTGEIKPPSSAVT